VKRLCADDSELSLVKVGHRQATQKKNPSQKWLGFFAFKGPDAYVPCAVCRKRVNF
jgi:hypothetical protein